MLLEDTNAADGFQTCWGCESPVSRLPPSASWERDLNVALYVYSDPISNPPHYPQ